MITRNLCVPAGAALVALALSIPACDSVPLLAPSGSTITLTSQATALPANGRTTILAQVIEPAGTPPHAGTLVTFSTNLGTLQPIEVETDIAGRALTTFVASGGSGVATINAISGGVSAGVTGVVRIAVGAAAASGILLTASPLSLPAAGGSSTITAMVNDNSGNGLAGVAVSFTTDAGSLTQGVVTTDSSGFARTVLTTGKTTKVTATAGVSTTSGTTTTAAPTGEVTVTVNGSPNVVFSAFTPAPAVAGLPVSGTLTITPVSGVAIRSVSVNWGDGQTQSLGTSSGAIPVSHVYGSSGTYTVSATVIDSNGDPSNGLAQIAVVPKPRPQLALTASPNPATVGQVITFTATVSQTTAGVTVDHYEWVFGDNSGTRHTTSNTTTKTYGTGSTSYVVTGTAVMSDGVRSSSEIEVRVN